MGRHDSEDGITGGGHMGYHRPNGSDNVLSQYVRGLMYVDELGQGDKYCVPGINCQGDKYCVPGSNCRSS